MAKGSWKAGEHKGGDVLGDGLPAELSRELAAPRAARNREMMVRLHRVMQWKSSPWEMQGLRADKGLDGLYWRGVGKPWK